VIISVRQGYRSIKGKQDYRMKLEITYEEREVFINIGKAKDNYNKDRKPKYFNYNIYRYMAKYCKKPKKEKETRKYYKCNKVGHIAKNYRSEQNVKNRSVQDNSDNEDNNKEKNFVGV